MIEIFLQAGDSLERRTEDGLMDVADVAEVYGQIDCLRFILVLIADERSRRRRRRRERGYGYVMLS